MIKPDQIPDEVWHTAMSTYHKTIKKRPGSAWQEAIAAALNAWPGVFLYPMNKTRLVLPLPQEGRSCTCHPSEAPTPCQQKYALGECIKAALEGRDE